MIQNLRYNLFCYPLERKKRETIITVRQIITLIIIALMQLKWVWLRQVGGGDSNSDGTHRLFTLHANAACTRPAMEPICIFLQLKWFSQFSFNPAWSFILFSLSSLVESLRWHSKREKSPDKWTKTLSSSKKKNRNECMQDAFIQVQSALF